MKRTSSRPVAAGRMSVDEAWTFALVTGVLGIFIMGYWFNWTAAGLSAFSLFLYGFVYTPLKKVHSIAVLVGAIPGAIPPLMGYTSANGAIDNYSLGLFTILFIWQIPHFLAISIMHDKDYQAANIKVFPNIRGIDFTNRLILKFSFFLLYVALIPWFLKSASEGYRNAALGLSAILIYLAIKGRMVLKNDFLIRKWARTYFLGTIFYIPFLFAALVFFK
jgi:protoheme IX farnesyltransferase